MLKRIEVYLPNGESKLITADRFETKDGRVYLKKDDPDGGSHVVAVFVLENIVGWRMPDDYRSQ